MIQCKKAKEFSTLLQEGEDKYYSAGLNGEKCVAFPKVTLTTTDEKISQMINDTINGFCAKRDFILDTDLRKLSRFMSQSLINSYRKGLLERIS